MNFSNFLKLISNQAHDIVMEADQETLLNASINFISKQVEGNGYCSWTDVYKYLGSEYKVNNANITNPLKPKLLERGFLFLNFPMLQMITKEKAIHHWEWKMAN